MSCGLRCWQLTLLQAWGVTRSPGWNVPSWSISAEWFAYLLFPLLAPGLMWVRERGIALLIAAASLAAMALLFAMADWTLNTWVGAPALTRVFGPPRSRALSVNWQMGLAV
jgi:peptidoglycan/LPS O-acetylase OafA/YrhL